MLTIQHAKQYNRSTRRQLQIGLFLEFRSIDGLFLGRIGQARPEFTGDVDIFVIEGAAEFHTIQLTSTHLPTSLASLISCNSWNFGKFSKNLNQVRDQAVRS
jgi:hypothetical protein